MSAMAVTSAATAMMYSSRLATLSAGESSQTMACLSAVWITSHTTSYASQVEIVIHECVLARNEIRLVNATRTEGHTGASVHQGPVDADKQHPVQKQMVGARYSQAAASVHQRLWTETSGRDVCAGAPLMQMMCTAPSRRECRPDAVVCQSGESEFERDQRGERGDEFRLSEDAVNIRGVALAQFVDARARLARCGAHDSRRGRVRVLHWSDHIWYSRLSSTKFVRAPRRAGLQLQKVQSEPDADKERQMKTYVSRSRNSHEESHLTSSFETRNTASTLSGPSEPQRAGSSESGSRGGIPRRRTRAQPLGMMSVVPG